MTSTVPEKIEAQTKAIHTAIGEAISAWSFVEAALLKIYVSAVSLTTSTHNGGHSQGDPAAIAVLHSVLGFHPKLKMIDTALKSNLEGLDDDADDILKSWKSVKGNASAFAKHRDRLAHWQVVSVNMDTGAIEVRLLPPLYGEKYHSHVSGAEPRIMRDDVLKWKKQFYECADNLGKIYWRIGAHQGLRDKFIQRVASQIQKILVDDPEVLSRLNGKAPWLGLTQAS